MFPPDIWDSVSKDGNQFNKTVINKKICNLKIRF